MAREGKRRGVNAEGKHDHVRRYPSSHATTSLNGATRHKPSFAWVPLGSVRDLHHFSVDFSPFFHFNGRNCARRPRVTM